MGCAVASERPEQETLVFKGVEVALMFKHGAGWQALRGSQGLTPQSEGSFGMELFIKIFDFPLAQKLLRLLPPTKETRSVASR